MSAIRYGDVDIHDPRTQVPPSVEPLFDYWMRDPHIAIGRDGWYYLSGTTRPEEGPRGPAWVWSDGARVWRSQDLKNWESLGLVWSLDEGPEWQRNFYVYWPDGNRLMSPEQFYADPPPPDVRVKRSFWGPKIHYSRRLDNYLIVGCMNFNMGVAGHEWLGDLFGGTFLLRSVSGEPGGPYEPTTDCPLTDYIDAKIFEQDDGTLHFIWQDGRIARLMDGLDGLIEVHDPWQTSYDPEPAREGVHLFKRAGRYHMVVTAFSWNVDGRYTYCHRGHGGPQAATYDAIVASSDNLYGPYGSRYTALTDGGHGNFFQDHEGNWWGCVFFPPGGELAGARRHCQRPALVPMAWEGDRILPDAQRAEEFYGQ